MLQITSSGHKKVMSWDFMKLVVSNFDCKLLLMSSSLDI